MTHDFDGVRHDAERLKDRYRLRDMMFDDMRQMFHMDWRQDVPGENDWLKITISPSAFNSVMGAVRLMISTEPQISVPFDEAQPDTRRTSEDVERFCKAMWNGSGRATQRPPHFDAIFSAVLFGEICGGVSKTSDLLAHAEKTKNAGNISRMKRIASLTPYIFKTYNPHQCYADFDSFGLRAMLRRTETTWGDVLATWGELAEQAVGGLGVLKRKPTDKIILNDWYDWEYRTVWLDEGIDPIIDKPHGFDFLPVVCQITDGNSLFTEPELSRTPMLYPVLKSGLWKRENLSLTTMYSLMHALGSSPLLVRRTNNPGSQLNIDRRVPGGVIDITPDESLAPLVEKVFDPSQMEGYQMASQLNEQSTINKQALGAPPNVAMAFSAISLLSQSGRLPLTGPARLGAEWCANMLMIALRWYKADAERMKFNYSGKSVDIDPNDIPDEPTVKVVLEPDLPQDKFQLSQVFNTVTQSGGASKRWARENILGIGQSAAMDKEIWMERRTEAELQAALQAVQAQAQMKIQQAQAMAAQQAQAQQAAANVPDAATAQNGAMPQGNQVQPGLPLQAPLPPRGAPQA